MSYYAAGVETQTAGKWVLCYLGEVESGDEEAHLQVYDQIQCHVRGEAGVA